jgi:hypothetical protein
MIQAVFPSSFFVETHWDTISGVTIDYRVKLGASVRTYRTTKPSQRWRVPDDMPKRNVFLMDASRTLPLDAPVGYAKIARQAAAEVSTSQIDNDLRGRLSHILGRDYRNARFAVSDADARFVNLSTNAVRQHYGDAEADQNGANTDKFLHGSYAAQSQHR